MKGRGEQHLPRYSIGIAAMAVAIYFLCSRSDQPLIVIASLFFLVICATDTLQTKIPNLACLSLAISGFACNYHTSGWEGILAAIIGLSAGFGLLFIPYLMGGMGGGDVKALAALGSLVGAAAIFQVFLYAGLAGGLMALFHYLLAGDLLKKLSTWRQRLTIYMGTRKLSDLPELNTAEKLRFPYAAALAMGYFAYISLGGMV